MAISVNTIYQRVLIIANKEQRGYITPQEFNSIANQAQQEIFEQYFYDINQRSKLDAPTPGVKGEEDLTLLLNEKIAHHTSIATVTDGTTFPANYMISKVFLATDGRECEKLSRNEVLAIIASTRHISLLSRSPIYCDSVTGSEDIEVYNSGGQVTGSAVSCEIVNRPTDILWAYTVVGGKALYNASASDNVASFDLHDSEETNLINKICELAGMVMNKAGFATTFSQREINENNIKKQ